MLDQLIVAVPVADRRRAHDFYVALGLEAFGPEAADGLPEPLQHRLTADTALMAVPRGGFEWATGDATVAPAGTVSCQLGIGAEDPTGVDALLERAVAAGARVVSPATQQPWGYEGSFADPDGHLWSVTAGPVSPPADA